MNTKHAVRWIAVVAISLPLSPLYGDPEPRKWEYKIIREQQTGNLEKEGVEGIAENMNALGREGWELVSSAYRPYNGSNISPSGVMLHFFKRPMPFKRKMVPPIPIDEDPKIEDVGTKTSPNKLSGAERPRDASNG